MEKKNERGKKGNVGRREERAMGRERMITKTLKLPNGYLILHLEKDSKRGIQILILSQLHKMRLIKLSQTRLLQVIPWTAL